MVRESLSPDITFKLRLKLKKPPVSKARAKAVQAEGTSRAKALGQKKTLGMVQNSKQQCD